ncbi:hypothetical protein J6TS2_21590 [Heyndrickxia sporothermodurans]|nr:hypothetical protein J6TS2_21590 [Heyndrickxia sporothermodurans]
MIYYTCDVCVIVELEKRAKIMDRRKSLFREAQPLVLPEEVNSDWRIWRLIYFMREGSIGLDKL